MKRSRRKPLSPEERKQAERFHDTFQDTDCAVCGTNWAQPDVHHVVAASYLRDHGLPVYDKRNGLPLCPIGSVGRGEQCHERHENASKRVPFRKLRAANIDYAYEVLGDYASDYLRRFYPMGEQ